MPIIVGLQSLFAVTDDVPASVTESIECDYLITSAETIRNVIRELGIFSEFQKTQDIFADPLGLATVVLPEGWRERLQPLKDLQGNICAYCLELHDTAVSKLMAGREKDFIFIAGLLEKGLISLNTFVKRAATIQNTASADALLPRLKKLENQLRTAIARNGFIFFKKPYNHVVTIKEKRKRFEFTSLLVDLLVAIRLSTQPPKTHFCH